MQAPSSLATLLNLASAVSPAKGASLLPAQGEVQGFQPFMMLLGDMGAQTGGKGQSALTTAARVPAQVGATGYVLAAQGLELPEGAAPDLTQPLTPVDAAALLTQLAAQTEGKSQQQGQPGQEQPHALEKVKAQLEQVVASDTPQTLGEVVEVISDPEEKLQVAGLLSGLLSVVKKVVTTRETQAATPQKEVPEQPMVNMAQLSALMFRPHDGAVSAAPTRAAAKAEKSEEIETSFDRQNEDIVDDSGDGVRLTFEPLAFTALVPQAAPVETPANAEPLVQPSVIDAMIPALTPVDTSAQTQVALPEVALPYVPGLMGQAVDRVSESPPAAADVVNTDSATLIAMSNAAPITEKTAQTDITGSVFEAWQKATALTDGVEKPVSVTTREAMPDMAQVGPVDSVMPNALQGGQPMSHAAKTLDLIPTPGLMNHATVKEQVQVAITKATQEGMDTITIQLDPGELGRVEVKMHTNSDGKAQISFLVDKAETFDSLSRDARFLERSLQEAGIKADTGGMQFNLRQQPQPQFQSHLNDGRSQQQHAQHDEAAAANDTSVSAISAASGSMRNYLINVREGVDISA